MNKKNIWNRLIILLFIIIVGSFSYIFVFSNKIVEVQDISLNKYSLKLEVGKSAILNIEILPEDATNKEIVWESENDNIASVSNGIVTANNAGNTIINVKSKDGKASTKCFVYVENKKVESVILNKESLDLIVGDKERLTATITPSELQNDDITWATSNSKVAIVDQFGEVEARGQGTATITIMSSDGSKNASCIVKVSGPPAILVESVRVKKDNITLAKGTSEVLDIEIIPFNATDKSVSWTSSNSNVVSVDNGKIIAKAPGTATIKVTTADGEQTATSTVRVLDIKTFDQRNDAIIAYMNNVRAVKNVYNQYKCSKTNCQTPKSYSPSFSGNINIYQYNLGDNTKTFIASTSLGNISYFLIPNRTYYIESIDNKNQVEIVKITGNLRALHGLGNFRDLGGWQADGGKIKYGKLFRSANTNSLKDLVIFGYLGINKVVDLRGNYEINSKSAVESIRTRSPIEYYRSDIMVRTAVERIMTGVVNENKNVLFNCNIGRDRTGTIAYIIEGILGVNIEDCKTDFELTYFYSTKRTRTDGSFDSLIKQFNKYGKTTYEQERFINWFLSFSSNKEKDLNLINNFRKIMIDGKPHEYKLSSGKLTLK